MKYLKSQTNDYLLEAPLEILHAQSLEWLEEVEFWKDEAAFFYAMIIGRTKQDPTVFGSKESKNVERHLIYVSAEKINDLKMEVEGHERFLERLIKNPNLDQQLYRTRHKAIAEKIHSFEHEFREMKKDIFRMAEKAEPHKKPALT